MTISFDTLTHPTFPSKALIVKTTLKISQTPELAAALVSKYGISLSFEKSTACEPH
jgi:hypothetical protein